MNKSISLITKGLSILLLVTIFALCAFAPMDWSYILLSGDDAGYYFGIARNACMGNGWTFDGLEQTNGFNPLLIGILTVIFKWVPNCDMEISYRLGLCVTVIAMGVSIYFLSSILRTYSDTERDQQSIWPILWVLLGFIGTKRIYGLDAPLLLMCGTGYMWAVLRSSPGDSRIRAVLHHGFWIGLLILARLDSLAFLVMAVGLSMLFAQRDWRSILMNSLKGVIGLLMLVPWIIWSTEHFGTWMPVSAKIKSAFPHINLQTSINTILNTSISSLDLILLGGAVAVASWQFGVVLSRRGWERWAHWSKQHQLLIILAAYTLGRLGYMILFSRADVQGGYVLLIHLYLMIQLWLLVRRKPLFMKNAFVVLLLLSGFMGLARRAYVAGPVFQRMAQEGLETEIQFAQNLDAVLPDDGLLFGGYFGIMGYVTPRSWVNLDGVVNTYEYQKVIRDNKLGEYFEKNNIRYAVFFHKESPEAINPMRLRLVAFQYDVTRYIEFAEESVVLKTKLADRMPERWLIVARIPKDL